MSAPTTSTGRGWAYTGALVGAGVSVAANVAHSYVPPTGATPSWSPHPGAVVGAVFWPVALLVAIEVLARVAWPPAVRWAVVRFGGLGPVAVVAAVVSYRHLSGLLAFYGEDPITATVGPLAVDGLMVMATGALLATSTATTTTVRTRPARTPASGKRRAADTAVAGDRTPARPVRAVRPGRVDTAARVSGADTGERVAALRGEGLTNAQIAAELGVSERTVRRHRRPTPATSR